MQFYYFFLVVMCFIPIVQIIINKVQPTTAAAAAVGSKRNYIPNCLLKDVHTKSIDGSPENKNPKMTFQLLGISTMSCSLKNSAKLSNYFILLSYQTVSKNHSLYETVKFTANLKIFPLQLLGPADKPMASPSSSKGKILR